MAEQFIYRSVKKTKGTNVVGSSQVNQGTGGSGSSGGGGSTLNPTLGELINVSKSSDTQTEEKVIKWNPTTKLWEPATPKTTIASLDNVDNNADTTNPTDSTVFLGIEPGGNIYKQLYLTDLLNGYAFEGDVSAQQEREFNVDFPEARPDTSYKLDVQGWKEQTVLFEGSNVVIRNIIQYHSLIKRVDGFSVKFFQIVDFLSYSALFKSNASPVPDFPHITIRMSGAGLMDFSVSGATGVKWIMQNGTIYSQNSEVPSGDINRPQIQFTEAGWVKLYVNDFSTTRIISNPGNGDRMISDLSDFSVTLNRLQFDDCPSLSGKLSDVKATSYFSVRDADDITGVISDLNTSLRNLIISRCANIKGDLADASFVDVFFEARGSNFTSLRSDLNVSANTIYLQDNDFSQLEIYNIIKYNYDLNNTNKTLNITNNSIPDATTLAMITEMQTNRGWTILHD